MPVVDNYTALLGGDYWNGIEVTGEPIIVTYSFPTSAPSYDSSAPGFDAATAASFKAFTAAEQAQAVQALGEWSAASGLIFVQVAAGQGDINFQNVDLSTTTGYSGDPGGVGFYPFGDWTSYSFPNYSGDLTASGDVFMNTLNQDPSDGSVVYGTLLHEIGHAIGLKHPTEVVDDYIPGFVHVSHDDVLASDDPNLTIMAQSGPTAGHLEQLDKDAAAYLYGPAGTGGVITDSASGSNSVSNWSWNATTQTMTQTAVSTGETIHGTSVDDVINGSSGNDSLFGLAGNNKIYAGDGDDKLYDGPGTNLLVGGKGDDSYYVTNSATTIVENPGEGDDDTVYARASYTLPVNVETLYLSGAGLTGKGNDQGDSIYGDGTNASTLIGGAGNDYMVGGAGDDTIEGDGGIDRMFGEGGADTFVFKAASDAPTGGELTSIGDFTSGQDKIDLSAMKTTGANPGQSLTFIGSSAFTDQAGQVNDVLLNGQTVLEGDLNGDGTADFQIAFDNVGSTPVSFQIADIVTQACYFRGTRILTEAGEVAVEALRVGDIVVTASGQHRPIKWLGHRPLDCARHPDPAAIWPVRISAGAFGDGKPSRDLYVTRGHSFLFDDVLIQAEKLINGVTIFQEPCDHVEIWHVELDSHDIIIAEGAPSESYLDTGNRSAFIDGDVYLELHPNFQPKHWRETCAPLVFEGPALIRVKTALLEAAAQQGHVLTTDPDLHILADGKRIEPSWPTETQASFQLPAGCSSIALRSRGFVPAHCDPTSPDERRLGVAVTRLQIDGVEFAIDENCALASGWNSFERYENGHSQRWTNGDTLLPVNAREIVIDLAGRGSYWADERRDDAVASVA